ncbi:hypothetical protein [Candidatus Lokiarchaeum ossiferum]|uniref:hypothetical protein n=1 Tax=Candidatus Lokiarchaeum ossiferum TaxID=2951803 RepID=UPI00352F2FDE
MLKSNKTVLVLIFLSVLCFSLAPLSLSSKGKESQVLIHPKAADDEFEDNDTNETATEIFIGWGTNQIIQADDDWYALESNMTTILDVNMGDPDIDDEHPTLELEIYHAGELIATNTKSANTPSLSTFVQVIDKENYTFHISGEDLGLYYGLSFTNVTDDNFEENDVKEDAQEVFIGWGTNQILQYDDDWYVLDSVHSNMTTILEVHMGDPGINDEHPYLELEVYHDDELIAENAKSNNILSQPTYFQIVEGETYYFRISGPNFGYHYGLSFANVTDDDFEENDVQETAQDVFVGWGIDQILQYDDDWYNFTASEEITLQILFSCEIPAPDYIRFTVYLNDSLQDDGTVYESSPILARYVSISPGDEIEVKVYGTNAGAPYGLSFTNFTDDAYEDNDEFSTAAPLVGNATNLVYGDADWFSIQPTVGHEYVSIQLTFEFGDLGIWMYDSTETEIEAAATDPMVGYLLTAGETYSFQVVGEGFAGQFYNISWWGTVNPEDNADSDSTSDTTSDSTSDTTSDTNPDSGGDGFNIPGYSIYFIAIFALGGLIGILGKTNKHKKKIILFSTD